MDYSQADINHMRQDALRRTREMHSRSGYTQSNVQAKESPPISSERFTINENARKENSSAEYRNKNNSNPLSGLLSGFFTDGKLDNDKIIIIALIFILAKEGADLKLLIALGYILM